MNSNYLSNIFLCPLRVIIQHYRRAEAAQLRPLQIQLGSEGLHAYKRVSNTFDTLLETSIFLDPYEYEMIFVPQRSC